MQVPQRFGLCFILLITLSSFTTNALASCPQIVVGPPCFEFGRADAVFIGVATRVVKVPNTEFGHFGPYLQSTVHFTIEEAFKGVGGTGLVLNLDNCGHDFNEGQRYLVYANRNHYTQQLDVRIGNTRTRLLSEATEDLQYIRGLATAEDGARVFGKVEQYSSWLRRHHTNAEPLKNIKIILEGANQRLEVLTDSEGKYEFTRLPKGTYQLQAELPKHLSFDKQTFTITDRGCVPLNIDPWSKGQITGSVLDGNGQPVPGIGVSLVSADVSVEEMLAESKDNALWPATYSNNHSGRFQFDHLRPGRYLLILNRTEFERSRAKEAARLVPRLFYPGVNDVSGATVIVVGKENEKREYDFRLP